MERKGIKLLEELLQTEKNYIEQLSEIIKYLDYTEKSKMPENLKQSGKIRIVFGNIRKLVEFHETKIYPDIERTISTDDVTILSKLFSRRKNEFKYIYGIFCMNHQKSKSILHEFQEYFTVS